jgi:hypothetical protein
MSLDNVYTIAGMQSGMTVYKDIRTQRIAPQVQRVLAGGSGGVYDTFTAVGKAMPIIDFTSGDLKTILADLTSQIARAIDGDFSIWFQKMEKGGLRSAGATHTKGTVAAGMIIPVSLTLQDGQSAALSAQVVLTSADGSTSPLALAGITAMVASAGAAALWTLGPVTINGTVLEGVESVTINFGIEPATLGGSGLVYPTFTGVAKMKPTIAITAQSVDEFLAWGLTGAAQGATDSTIQIDDMAQGGLRGVAPIVCTIDDGHWGPDTVDLNDGQGARHAMTCQPTFDGIALPLAWSGLS